ncbi:MAG: hypothetical protein ACK5NX_01260 [Armatimonadota bacterium]|jgi:hypothetical protein
MSGFAITQRAFRFTVGSREFAIDIQSNVLFETEPGGIGVSLYEREGAVWLNKFIEFGQPLMGAGDAAINAAGGVVPFCRLIVERVNRALNVIFGGGDLEPPENLAEAVQDYLLANLQVVYVEGKPQVRLP